MSRSVSLVLAEDVQGCAALQDTALWLERKLNKEYAHLSILSNVLRAGSRSVSVESEASVSVVLFEH